MKLAIIGSGISGLSAAYYLSKNYVDTEHIYYLRGIEAPQKKLYINTTYTL